MKMLGTEVESNIQSDLGGLQSLPIPTRNLDQAQQTIQRSKLVLASDELGDSSRQHSIRLEFHRWCRCNLPLNMSLLAADKKMNLVYLLGKRVSTTLKRIYLQSKYLAIFLGTSYRVILRN